LIPSATAPPIAGPQCRAMAIGIAVGRSFPATAASTIRRHENRQAEAGEMMQRLVDADQRPEPWVLVFLRYAKCRCAKSFGAIDGDVDRKINHGDEPEPWRDDQDQRHRDREMDETVRQQWQSPSGLLVLADRHP